MNHELLKSLLDNNPTRDIKHITRNAVRMTSREATGFDGLPSTIHRIEASDGSWLEAQFELIFGSIRPLILDIHVSSQEPRDGVLVLNQYNGTNSAQKSNVSQTEKN